MNYSITRKGIGLSAAIAGLLAFAPVASAVEVEMSGHVDRMVRAADNNGTGGGASTPRGGSDVQHLDNGSDQSRLQVIGTQEMNGGIGGVDVEMRIGDTSECYDIKQDTASGGNFSPGGGGNGGTSQTCDQTVEWSRADAWWEGGWGKVSLGKGDSATRGADRADLSGTDLGFNYDNRRNASLSYFVPGGGSSGITYGNAFLMYEGQRSQNRARYDSPVFAGIQIKGSTANTEKYAVGVTYATAEERDFQLRVAAGYTDVDDPVGGTAAIADTLTSISASAMLGFGLNFTAGYGLAAAPDSLAAVAGTGDTSNIHFKVGYFFGDNIAVAIRYMTGSDVGFISGVDSDSIGIGAQWSPNEWVQVYGALEQSSLDAGTSGSSEDLTTGTVGLKVGF